MNTFSLASVLLWYKIDLLHCLLLPGTCTDLRTILTLFQVTTSQEYSVLEDVSGTVVQAGKSLEETASNDKRLECLKKLSKCYQILIWLKTVGNGKCI